MLIGPIFCHLNSVQFYFLLFAIIKNMFNICIFLQPAGVFDDLFSFGYGLPTTGLGTFVILSDMNMELTESYVA